MTQGSEYGKLLDASGAKIGIDQLAFDVRLKTEFAEQLIEELKAHGVCSVDDSGVIFCRRMIRESELSEAKSAAGKLGGNPTLKNKTDEDARDHILYSRGCLSTPDKQEDKQELKQQDKQSTEKKSGMTDYSINPPTLDDIKKAAINIAMRAEDVESCFNHYDSQGWKHGSGMPVTSLSSLLAKWKARANQFDRKDDPAKPRKLWGD
jgi:hypothetical protein